jgi:three-Cys-motif partner protein
VSLGSAKIPALSQPLLAIEHKENIPMGFGMLDDDGLLLDEVGAWAKEKHERLRKYVDISRGVRRKFLQGGGGATYIDLFCGAGRAYVRDSNEKIDGSPLVAFKSARDGGAAFSQIHIADVDSEKVSAAAKRIADAGGATETYAGKAEDVASRIVAGLNPRGLHFAFLDPYNLDSLPFAVIEILGRLQRIDMLIHVSAQDLQRNLAAYTKPGDDRLERFAP